MDPNNKRGWEDVQQLALTSCPGEACNRKKMMRRRQEGEKKQKIDTRGNQNRNYDETTSKGTPAEEHEEEK